jgi:hypothetical protein
MAKNVKRRLAAILDAGAVGYSRLMGADEEARSGLSTPRRDTVDGRSASTMAGTRWCRRERDAEFTSAVPSAVVAKLTAHHQPKLWKLWL